MTGVDYAEIRVEQRGPVRLLSVDRADRRNALTTRTAGELESALRGAADDPDTRAVVLAGVGEHFSAGGDVTAILDHIGSGDDRDLLALMRAFHRLVVEIWESPLPVVAAVSGVAYGGGFNLALACDLVV
ncbi:MAG TPA: enoyl-CoA hydratase/isomerase family protein, partial [Acidimicrobiales bacterium]|nr:enoyl-CoA hydratase/isomerase family protein [Acidimicrobiales bacterium]